MPRACRNNQGEYLSSPPACPPLPSNPYLQMTDKHSNPRAGEWQVGNPRGLTLKSHRVGEGPVEMAPRASMTPVGPARPSQPGRVCSQLSVIPPPPSRRATVCFPNGHPPAAPVVLWGLGGTLRSQGRAGPKAGGLAPKQPWDGPQGPCQLTYSLSWVEPEVRFYCKSRKILAGQATREPSPVRGLWGLSCPFPRKL